jgi:hypothetical protein
VCANVCVWCACMCVRACVYMARLHLCLHSTLHTRGFDFEWKGFGCFASRFDLHFAAGRVALLLGVYCTTVIVISILLLVAVFTQFFIVYQIVN